MELAQHRVGTADGQQLRQRVGVRRGGRLDHRPVRPQRGVLETTDDIRGLVHPGAIAGHGPWPAGWNPPFHQVVDLRLPPAQRDATDGIREAIELDGEPCRCCARSEQMPNPEPITSKISAPAGPSAAAVRRAHPAAGASTLRPRAMR